MHLSKVDTVPANLITCFSVVGIPESELAVRDVDPEARLSAMRALAHGGHLEGCAISAVIADNEDQRVPLAGSEALWTVGLQMDANPPATPQ